MKTAWAAACILFAASESARAAGPLPVEELGIGMTSCGNWTPQSDHEVEPWILGYWTGLNRENIEFNVKGTVGSTTDAPGVLAAARKFCERDETMSISSAVHDLYFKLFKENR